MKSKHNQKEIQVRQLFMEASQHHHASNIALAEAFYRKILEIDPRHFDALHMIGVIGNQTNHLEEAIPFFEKARALRPNDVGLLVNYGSTLRKSKKYDEALALFNRALKLQPDFPQALYNKAQCLVVMGSVAEAAACYRQSIAVNPNHAESYLGLANALPNDANWNEAIVLLEKALKLRPRYIEALVSMSMRFRQNNKIATAKLLLEQAVELEPRNPIARAQLSLLLLQAGHYKEGWQSYEGRFWYSDQKVPRRPVPPMYWAGEDLSDKSIYIWPEQGIGDEIFYSSMIPDLVARCPDVTLECSKRMHPVFSRSFPQIKVVQSSGVYQPSPEGSRVTLQCPLASLGQFLRPDLKSFPARNSYLVADAAQAQQLRSTYGSKKVVGVSWRSSAALFGNSKSSRLEDWGQILSQSGVSFVSLQYGDIAEELRACEETLGTKIINDESVDQLVDMDIFFSQVSAVDLVITTSNTAAHVAGAVGKETWLLLPYRSGVHWYWGFDGASTPWYPSIKIFRQHENGNWPSLIEEVSSELKQWAARGM